jgi:hypothetical protein
MRWTNFAAGKSPCRTTATSTAVWTPREKTRELVSRVRAVSEVV